MLVKNFSVLVFAFLYCFTVTTCDEYETTTDQAFVITTIEPSSREVWGDGTVVEHDFAVPDPSAPLPPVKISPDADQADSPASSSSSESSVSESSVPVDVTPTIQHVFPIKPSSVSSSPETTLFSSSVVPTSPENGNVNDYKQPEIYSFHIESRIRYRYSRTYITSRVVNRNLNKSSEVRFRVVLPETAFISKFLMEIDGKTYEAYVKEKEEAKNIYNEAQSQGQSAGLVELNTRNTNIFDVNVNIKAQSKVNFNLTYEELLSRRLGKYEQSINISPEQVSNVKDFQILVTIEESQNITLLKVPELRNDVDAVQDEEGNNKDAVIERPAGNKANITWKPSQEAQSQLDKQKLTGKFVVQYDVARELDAGEVLVMQGYFVHYFSPSNLKPLKKHVVFVLDTSGSMWGRRLEQLKDAMTKILADLNSDDYFNLITFASDVVFWSPSDKTPSSPNSHWSPPGEPVSTVIDASKRQPYPATKENVERAQLYIKALVASGGTNIHDSVVQALNLTNAIKQARDGPAPSAPTSTTANPQSSSSTVSTSTTTLAPTTSAPSIRSIDKPLNVLPPDVESLIIFLTDGEPTVGVTSPSSLQSLIKAANVNSSIPIFSLGFGDGADFPFLRKLSLQNNGFARKIYEASDAAIQLKGFYNEIASPLLSNVTFNYTSPDYSIENVTITKYPTLFGGTEIAVAGKIVPKESVDGKRFLEANDDVVTTSSTPKPRVVIVGDTPAISTRLNDLSEDAIVPTDRRYFDVYIEGYGRDGTVHFTNPEIFSSPIPWSVPVVRPFPPRPTVPPTQEDVFLERLWAYLTIRQLIDKDLAQDAKSNEIPDTIVPTPATGASVSATTFAPGYNGSDVTQNVTVPETPKKRALRLALKYGFVTPLTSLVVVKPNSSDVTNAVPTDPQAQDTADYAALSIRKTSFTSNRISSGFVPLSLHYQPAPNRIVGFGPPPPAAAYPYPHFPANAMGFATFSTTRPSYPFTTTAASPYYPSTTAPSLEPVATTALPSLPPHPESSGSVETDENIVEEYLTTVSQELVSPTSEPPLYGLSDLSWYNGSGIVNVNQSDYNVAGLNDSSSNNFQSLPCSVDSDENGSIQGVCVHLKDCVQASFKDDFGIYTGSYFCSIESSSLNQGRYAGVCCIKDTSSSVSPSSNSNKRGAFRKDSLEDLSYS